MQILFRRTREWIWPCGLVESIVRWDVMWSFRAKISPMTEVVPGCAHGVMIRPGVSGLPVIDGMAVACPRAVVVCWETVSVKAGTRLIIWIWVVIAILIIIWVVIATLMIWVVIAILIIWIVIAVLIIWVVIAVMPAWIVRQTLMLWPRCKRIREIGRAHV